MFKSLNFQISVLTFCIQISWIKAFVRESASIFIIQGGYFNAWLV